MDLSSRTDLGWDNGVPFIKPNETVIDKGLLEPVVQEMFNTLIGHNIPPISDVTQLYQLLKQVRAVNKESSTDIDNAFSQYSFNFQNRKTDFLNQLAAYIDAENSRLTDKLNTGYKNINAALDFLQNQLQTFAQAICGMPFAWPSDSVFPPDWYVIDQNGNRTDHPLVMISDGSSFDPNLYPMLAKVYPNCILPDIREQYLRGWDNGAGRNPDATPVLGRQLDAVWVGTPSTQNQGEFTISGTGQGDANGWLDPTGCFSLIPSRAYENGIAGGGGKHCKHDVYNNTTQVAMNLSNVQGMEEHIQMETRPRTMPITWIVYAGIHKDDLGVGDRNR